MAQSTNKRVCESEQKIKKGLFEGFLWPQNLQDFKLFTKLSVIIQVIIITGYYLVSIRFLILMAWDNCVSYSTRPSTPIGNHLSDFLSPPFKIRPQGHYIPSQGPEKVIEKILKIWPCKWQHQSSREILAHLGTPEIHFSGKVI